MSAKKLASVFLTCIMAVGLMTGCGTSNSSQSSSDDGSTTANTSEAENTTPDTASQETTEEPAEDTSSAAEAGKTLVVYYSATGTTKGVAETIAEITGGDLFEIQPKEPYTDADLDWTDNNSRVSKEHDDESLRDVELVSTAVDNWDSYGTVYIGYPIWWGIAAWPVDNFVKANDFSGKTVIPFCTSASSGMGDSGELLEEMAGTGDWQEGERFRSGASDSDVTEWVNSLGLGK